MSDDGPDHDWVDAAAAQAIAWVQPHCPAGVELATTGSGPTLQITTRAPGAQVAEGPTFGFGSLATQPGVPSPATRLRIALTAFLDGLQDWVVLNTKERWPGDSQDADALHARSTATTVTVWFGPEDEPTIPLLSIEVDVDGG